MLNVLIACEESQRVCIEMRKLGHRAFSCDILPCSGGHPEWHIQDDVLPLLNGDCTFQTMDGKSHKQRGRWDLIIAHPPCTYLTAASAVRLYGKDHTIKDVARYSKGVDAACFFNAILNADCEQIAVENPRMLKVFGIRPPDQTIEPYWFGDPWRKRTCLWLRGLPTLVATNMVEPKGLWVGSTCANRDPTVYMRYELTSIRNSKTRAKTFPGIARAMAEQWTAYIENGETEEEQISLFEKEDT